MLSKHLLRLLTLFALLVAPLGMLGGGAAMAAMPSADASASGGHCAEMAASQDQAPDEPAPAKSDECMMDCMMLCAGMLSITPQLAEPLTPSPVAVAAANSPIVWGLAPQAEPRPPRIS